MKNSLIALLVIVILASIGGAFVLNKTQTNTQSTLSAIDQIVDNDQGEMEIKPHALTIESLRNGDYSGSNLVIEQTLTPGSNYSRHIVSYKSEGLKIYALLTIPTGTKPEGGWPAIVFNHGYIPPSEYRTTEKYIAYTDAFSRNGYILLRPDYRGHGNSEGQASGGYGSNDYTIDVLNALASLKKHPEVNVNKVGMWGHSMGGHITLRSMVVNKDIKAGVIWAGVVGSYPDLLARWRRGTGSPTPQPTSGLSRRWRQVLIDEFGEPSQNPTFWNSISSNSYLSDISGPLQVHHGTADTSVPVEFSQTLKTQMDAVNKDMELYIYNGDDHNLSQSFSTAITRSVQFFDKYLK